MSNSLSLIGTKSRAKITIIPTEDPDSPFVCEIKNSHGKTFEKNISATLTFIETTPAAATLAFRLDKDKNIVAWHYANSFLGKQIFKIYFNAENEAWTITKLGDKKHNEPDETSAVPNTAGGYLDVNFPTENFAAFCEGAPNSSLFAATVPKLLIPKQRTVKVVAAQKFELPDAVSFARLQNELRKYVRSEKYISNPPSPFPGHDAEAIFHYQTDGQSPIWFIGDLHGDLLALKTITDFAHKFDHDPNSPNALSNGQKTNIFFLGDFIDRGELSAEVCAWIMGTAAGERFDGKEFDVRAIIGNHDAAFGFDGAEFTSDVMPAEFHMQLNESPDAKSFGEAIISFFAKMPAAVFLDSTLLAVHGGIPHPVKFRHIQQLSDFYKRENTEEFYWVRLHKNLPHKQCAEFDFAGEIGYEDFNDAITILGEKEFFGTSPQLLLRGHEHEPDNFAEYIFYTNCKVLTINAMSTKRVAGGLLPQQLAAIRWCPSDPLNPTVFTFYLPEDTINETQNNFDLPTIIAPTE